MRVFMAIALVSCTACSFLYDWDVGKLKCNTDPNQLPCLTGYTCLNSHCVANGSLGEGQPCALANQCGSGLSCSQSFIDRPCTNDPTCNTCLAACPVTDAYTTQGCAAGGYCMPYCAVPAGAELGDGTYPTCNPNNQIAACAPSSSCTPNTTCTLTDSTATGVCTVMATGTTACLRACSFTWSPGYNDSCEPQADVTDNPVYCTPVGNANNQQMVCVALGGARTTLPLNQTGCNTLAMPCSRGNACINNVCAQLCQLGGGGAACINGATCTAIPGLGPAPTGITRSNTGYCP